MKQLAAIEFLKALFFCLFKKGWLNSFVIFVENRDFQLKF